MIGIGLGWRGLPGEDWGVEGLAAGWIEGWFGLGWFGFWQL